MALGWHAVGNVDLGITAAMVLQSCLLSAERMFGSIRLELLDQTFFWTTTDLENALQNSQRYYNEYGCHSGRAGVTPMESGGNTIGDINQYRWEKHCRGLFQLPAAA